MSRPKLKESWSNDAAQLKFVEVAEEHMDYMERDGHGDNDDAHYIFEAVMEELYGPEMWEWYRERQG